MAHFSPKHNGVISRNMIFYYSGVQISWPADQSDHQYFNPSLLPNIEDGSTEALLQIPNGQYLILGVFGSYMF